jgi:hypothetical protein
VPFTLDRVGPAALIVFAQSPEDGSRIDAAEIPPGLEE